METDMQMRCNFLEEKNFSVCQLLARPTTFTSNQNKKETNSKCFLLLSRRVDVTGELTGAAHLSLYLFSPIPSGKYF